MNWPELKIPKFVRRQKGQPMPERVVPEDVELPGDSRLAQQLVDNFLARAGKVATPAQRACKKLVGKGTPDKDAGELLGAAHGRYWYLVP